MKNLSAYPALLVLVILFQITGVITYANSEPASKITSQKKHSVQVCSQNIDLFYEEVNPIVVIQTLAEKKSTSHDNWYNGAIELQIANLKKTKNIYTESVRDLDKLINQQIFPFHFFW